MSGSLYALGAVYGTQIGLSVFENSVFMGAPIIGGFLLQWPIGRLSDKFDRRTVLFGVLMATVAASVLLGAFSFAQGSFLLLATANLLLGGFLATIYPTAVAHADHRHGGGTLSLCWNPLVQHRVWPRCPDYRLRDLVV